jgi:hypothetical protein
MPGYTLCYIHNDQVNKYNLTPFANIGIWYERECLFCSSRETRREPEGSFLKGFSNLQQKLAPRHKVGD